MRRPASINLVIAIQVLIGIGVIAYWAAWLASPELVRAREPGSADYVIYVAFEGAFLLADLWVAGASLTGAAGLWLMRDWGLPFTLLGAGAGIFLGLIDLLYDLEHATFAPLSGSALLELMIVIGLLVLCPLSAYLVWQDRRSLHARPAGERTPLRRRPRKTATASPSKPKAHHRPASPRRKLGISDLFDGRKRHS
jgi:hypothetical protein